MLHVTCDWCHKELLLDDRHRYVVKMEVFAAPDADKLTEADLEQDHLEAVSELLRAIEDGDEDIAPEPAYRHFRYDLCLECHKKFIRNPLGKELGQKFDFSKN